MEKILMLGASKFQIPPIKYAREKGYHVITADYLPENPGHAFANESYNVSTTDEKAVLALAKDKKIDGIIAYASDPSAPAAAYVGNLLGLPSNPYDSVKLLTRKDLFRDFLRNNGFNAPLSKSFYDFDEAKQNINAFEMPVMVKPVDSSGSKGVSKITSADELEKAFNYALSFSREKKVIIEEFVERSGYQIAGDGFVVDGKLVFRCFAQEHFNYNCNRFVPIGESFPLKMPANQQQAIHDEVQRLLSLLNMKTGALNFDIFIGKNGKIYLMEIGPRNGGNLIPEIIRYSTGVDLIAYTVEAALGHDCSSLKMYDKADFCSSFMLHSEKDGFMDEVFIADEIRPSIISESVYVSKGDKISAFNGSNNTLGCYILKFASEEEMVSRMDTMYSFINVKLLNN